MRIPTTLLPFRAVLTGYLQLALLVVGILGVCFGLLPEIGGVSAGWIAMAVAPFPIQPELAAIAVAYRNSRYVADSVLPRVPVGSSEFKYFKYALGEGFTLPDTKVGRKSAPNEVEFSATETTDKTQPYGLDDPIPQDDIDKARAAGYDPVGRAVEGVTDLVLLDREKRTADKVFDANNYGAANKVTLAGTSQWSDFTNSNPVSDVTTGLDAMVMRANVMVFGRAAWTKFSQHPKICKAVFGNNTDAGIVTRAQIAALFELDEVVVGEGWINTAKKGQAASLARIWGKHASLIFRDGLATPDGKRVTFGFTAQFGPRIAGAQPDSKIGLKGGQRVRVGEEVQEVITANDMGYFFQNAVA